MQAPRQNLLSQFFQQWAELCFDHAKTTLSLCILFIAILASQIPLLTVDISTEAMLRKTDPARVNYQEFRKAFGRDDVIILSTPTNGLLTKPLLASIYDLQKEIDQKVPYIKEITSLINTRYSYGEDDELIVEELLENYPNHKWDSRTLTEFVLKQPAYVNRLISADGSHTAIIIELATYADPSSKEFLSEAQSAESFHALRKIIDAKPELNIAMSGEPVLLTITNELTASDTTITGSAALVMVILFMLISFKRLSGILMPLSVIYGSIIGTLGLMGFFGAPFTMTTSAVVVLILGIGVADVVHILSLFYRHFDEHNDKRAAIIYAMSHSAPAVFLTTLTTATGFLSFLSGDLASTSELGIYAAIMVGFALFYTLTLLPTFISLFKIKQKIKTEDRNERLLKLLSACGDLSIKHSKLISLTAIVAFGLSIWGTTFLTMSYDPINNFPDDLLERMDNEAIDKQYNGITAFEVVIDSGSPNGIYQTEFINNFEKAAELLSNRSVAGIEMSNSYSVLDILKEVHKSLNGNQDEFYQVPGNKELIAQELLLFEISQADDLYDVIDQNKQKVRLTLRSEHADGVEYEKLIRKMESQLDDIFGSDTPIVITGLSVLVAESVPKAIRTMSKSYVVAGVLIIAIMMILVKSFGIGLISIIPNVLPILLTMNFMVLIDWPLDMSTIMVGAIALGLVVDDSLHFLYHYKQNYLATQDVQLSIRKTLSSIGPALVITTAIFSSCLMVDLFSSIFSVYVFGACLAMIAVLALLADLIIVPALLTFVYDRSPKTSEGREQVLNKSRELNVGEPLDSAL